MYTRIFSIAALALVVSACSSELPKGEGAAGAKLELDDPLVQAEAEAAKSQAAANDNRLVCAVSGATAFARVCEVDRSQTDKGLLLTVRHPDGGFRRLLVVKDGRGVIAADGAEPAVVTPMGPKEIEVKLAGNRYRLPATVKMPVAAKALPAS